MSNIRNISLYAQASLFLLVSSITVSPAFSQDSISNSFAQADITASDITKAVKEIKLSQKDREEIIAAVKALVKEIKEDKVDKKEAKKFPTITPALITSLTARLSSIYLYYKYVAPFVKDTLKNEALSEILKISFVSWVLTEPFKDHTKPYYEFFRDSFDNYINNLFGYEKEEEILEESSQAIAAA